MSPFALSGIPGFSRSWVLTAGETPMKAPKLVFVAVFAIGAASAADKPSRKSAVHVAPAALIAAAKVAMLSEINYGGALCDTDRTVEAWLDDVVGDTAASVTWRGGSCMLTSELNPLDAGSKWCGGATIVPKNHAKEPARIEVYFEKPVGGKPGKPYAFRGENYDVDGLDYKRAFADFEYGYRQKYQAGYEPPEQRDCD